MTPSVRKKNVFTFLLALVFLVCVLPLRVVASEQPNKTTAVTKSSFAYKKAPVVKGAGNISFSVKMTVRGGSAEDENKEFLLMGMFRAGKFRETVPGDKWYGVSDVVYDDIQLYRESFNYQKINSENGSLLETGTITPLGQGIFSFGLKQNETIKFSVKESDNLSFCIYQNPDNRFTTYSVMNGETFNGTTNVFTGETVGVGAIPGGMETIYYENHPLGYVPEYIMKLKPISSDGEIEYVNTKKTTPKTYNVVYKFVSNNPNKKLPKEITALLPPKQTNVADGSEVVPTQPTKTKITLDDGVWSFEGYSATMATVNGADLEFVGRWNYSANGSKQQGYKSRNNTNDDILPSQDNNNTEAQNTPPPIVNIPTQPQESLETNTVNAEVKVAVTALTKKLKGKSTSLHGWIVFGCVITCINLVVVWRNIISDISVMLWYEKKKKRNIEKK